MITELIIKTDDQSFIDTYQVKLTTIKNYAENLTVVSAEDLLATQVNLNKTKARRIELDDYRKELVKPHNEFNKLVNGKMNPMIAEFKEQENKIDKTMQKYHFAEQEKARVAKAAQDAIIAAELEEQRKKDLAALEEEKKNFPTTQEEVKQKEEVIEKKLEEVKVEAELKVVQPEPTKISGLTEYIKYEIVNENEVPRNLCTPDSKKINAIKKDIEFGGNNEVVINGIKYFKEFKTK